MHRTHQRRQQRVAYAASVRLHTSGRPHPFDARSINLSRSGVLVESLQPCAVGTEVICEIPLPGGRRQLRGRVARMQALSPAAVGLAIAFTELGGSDQDLLSEAVGEDDGRTRIVQVRFEGMRDPMRSRAVLTPDGGLRLTTGLPFLRLRSPVEVTFLSGPSQVQSRGMVNQVELDQFAPDGTPRLAISVGFAADSDTQPVAAATAVAAAPAVAAVAAEPPPSTAPPAPAAPVVAARAPAAPQPPPAAPVVPRSQGGSRALALAAAVAIIGLGLWALRQSAAPIARTPAPPTAPAPLAAPAAAPIPAAPPAPAPVVVVAQPAPVPAPPPVVSIPIPPPLPPGTPGPTVESDGQETTAVVPVYGSTTGAIHYSLARRRGLVINLPEAISGIPLGLHAIGRDGLRYVWIRDRADGGLQVRFIFSRPPPDERLLELEDDAIRVRIRMAEPPVAGEPDPSILADTRE